MSSNDSGLLSSRCIENLLQHLKIKNFAIMPDSKTVQVKNCADLMKILINLAPFEGTEGYPRHLYQHEDKVYTKIGSWIFEAIVSVNNTVS